jgi:hypothetical protein
MSSLTRAIRTPLAPSVLPAGSIATASYVASREDETVFGLALFGNFLPAQSCILKDLLSHIGLL